MGKQRPSKENKKSTANKKRKVPASQRTVALAAAPSVGGTKNAKRTAPKPTPTTPSRSKSSRTGVGKHTPKSSAKKSVSASKTRTPGAPKNTSTYIMNNRKFGAQPTTPRPLSGMKSPRLESIATATIKPPVSGLDMFGSMLGALSPGATLANGLDAADGEAEAEHSAADVIKLCSIIAEQAKTIAKLEVELSHVRAQLQARAVAPVPTLKRATSTSMLTSRIGKLFSFS